MARHCPWIAPRGLCPVFGNQTIAEVKEDQKDFLHPKIEADSKLGPWFWALILKLAQGAIQVQNVYPDIQRPKLTNIQIMLT